MKWWVWLLVFLLSLQVVLAQGEFTSFTITPQIIDAGSTIKISAEFEGVTSKLSIRDADDSTIAGPFPCSSSPCVLENQEIVLNSPGEFSLRAFAIPAMVESDPISVTVSAPDSGGLVFPRPVVDGTPRFVEGQEGTLELTISNDIPDSASLTKVRVDFGDGTQKEVTCPITPANPSCRLQTSTDDWLASFSHTYQTGGSFTITSTSYFGSQTNSSTYTINIIDDKDRDGIADGMDVCLGTPSGATVASSGSYVGCSCQQINDQFDRPNPCLRIDCQVENDVVVVSESVLSSPLIQSSCSGDSWVERTCSNGVFNEASSPDDARCVGCDDLGLVCRDGDVYSAQSCAGVTSFTRETTCSGSSVCVDVDGQPRCVSPTSCNTAIGCKTSQPANTVVDVAGTCQTGLCYACRDGFQWDGSRCLQANPGYSLDVFDLIVPSGSSRTLSPKVFFQGSQIQNAFFRYSGFLQTESANAITIQGSPVGRHQLTINAFRSTGSQSEFLTSKEIEIWVRCDPSMACCQDGLYAPVGTECPGGVCNANGVCSASCPGTFENSQQTCSDGIDNNCNGIIDCEITSDGRINQGCQAFCNVFCPAGQTGCDNQCVNTDTSHRHCGACNIQCESNEVCQEGACVPQDDECFVACSDNQDCQGSCVNPGTCEAYCSSSHILDPSQLQSVTADIVRKKAYAVDATITNNELQITIRNLLSAPMRNATITTNIPANLSPSASELSADHQFEILSDNPVVRTRVAEIHDKHTITYYLPYAPDPATARFVTVQITNYTINTEEVTTLDNNDLLILRDFSDDEDGTTMTLTLRPGSDLENVRLPVEIPKCFAQSVQEMNINNPNFEIVDDDPLIVWYFDTLSTETTLTFNVPNLIDEDCRNQVKAFAMGNPGNPRNPWLPLAIIPVIGFALVFFQRFHTPGAQEHLDKEEFFNLARDQGMREEDIKTSWEEYKKKF